MWSAPAPWSFTAATVCPTRPFPASSTLAIPECGRHEDQNKISARDGAPPAGRARTLEALEVAIGRRLEEPPLRRAGTCRWRRRGGVRARTRPRGRLGIEGRIPQVRGGAMLVAVGRVLEREGRGGMCRCAKRGEETGRGGRTACQSGLERKLLRAHVRHGHTKRVTWSGLLIS